MDRFKDSAPRSATSPDTQPRRVSNKPIITPEVKKRNENLLSQVENEFDTSLKTVTLNEQLLHPSNQNPEFINSWKEIYRISTEGRGPEEKTERTEFLEGFVREALIKESIADTSKKDKLEKLSQNVRVVILNRGDELNAFAGPDGTIFITQKLINTLEKTDLIMGVVFHELGHILNEDYAVKKTSMRDLRSVQEVGADKRYTTRFLDEAGLNPLGLSEALLKIGSFTDTSGKSRDYMEYAQRSMAIEMDIYQEHFKNVNKPMSNAPEFLNVEAQHTNFEIFAELFATDDLESIKLILPKLKKEDLWKLRSVHDVYEKYHKEIDEIYSERLREIGFTEEQITYFLYSTLSIPDVSSFRVRPLYSNHIKSSQQLLDFSRNFSSLEGAGVNQKFIEALNHLVGNNKISIKSFEHPFLTTLEEHMVLESEPYFLEGKGGTPVNEDVLIEVLKEFKKYVNPSQSREKELLDFRIGKIIEKYALTCLKTNGQNDDEALVNFFTKVQESGMGYFLSEYFKDCAVRVSENRQVDIFQNYAGKSVNVDSQHIKNVFSAVKKVYNFPHKREVYIPPVQKYESLESRVNKKLEKLVNFQRAEDAQNTFTSILDEIKNETYRYRSEKEINKYIENIFASIDRLNFSDPTYFENPLNVAIPEYIKYGPDYINRPLPNFTKEYMEQVKEYATFQLKLITICKLKQTDDDFFYSSINKLMNETKIDFKSLDEMQLMRLIGPLVTLQFNGVPGNAMLFSFRASESKPKDLVLSSRRENQNLIEFSYKIPPTDLSRSSEDKKIDCIKISRLDKLEELQLIKEFVKKREDSARNINTISDLDLYYEKISAEYIKYLDQVSPSKETPKAGLPFEDDLAKSLHFESFRKAYIRILKSNEFSDTELDSLYKLSKKILPDSESTKELLSKIRVQYLVGSAEFSKKVEFFKQNANEMSYDELILLVDQIKGDPTKPGSFWAEWEMVESSLSDVFQMYIDGEFSATRQTTQEFYATSLGKITDIVDSTDPSPENKRKQSTKFAKGWIKTVMNLTSRNDLYFNLPQISYDTETGKVRVGLNDRDKFKSISDTFNELHNLPQTERMYLIYKSLIGEDGFLATPERRDALGKILRKSLGVNDPLIGELAEALAHIAKRNSREGQTFSIFASNLLGKKLFSSLDTSEIDIKELMESLKKHSFNTIEENLTEDEVRNLATLYTRGITAIGAQYYHPDSTLITPQVGSSDEDYNEALRILNERFTVRPTSSTESEGERELIVPQQIEDLFNAAESTVLGTRALQITRQMRRNDDPAIDRRMALSFDANPGMDKFRFFRALSSAARQDEGLQTFLRTRLIGFDKKLGGGSMATTYRATVLSENSAEGEIQTAIRCLIPSAEFQIEKTGELILQAIDVVESSSRKEGESHEEYTRKLSNAKLTRTIINLTREWCLADLGDDQYEERDDQFREQVLSRFNSQGQSSTGAEFDAPDRIYTSHRNLVRVEELARGVSIREYLDSAEVSESEKAEIVRQLISFNQYQYKQTPETEDGTVLVQSDPSIGNFLVEIITDEKGNRRPKIQVLDRGLMIPMNKKRLEMMNNLISNDPVRKVKFFNSFLDEIIEYNLQNNLEKYGFLKDRPALYTSELKKILIAEMLKKILANKPKSTLDIVTTVNDVLIEKGLVLPWELQIPIKNLVGLEVLRERYIK